MHGKVQWGPCITSLDLLPCRRVRSHAQVSPLRVLLAHKTVHMLSNNTSKRVCPRLICRL